MSDRPTAADVAVTETTIADVHAAFETGAVTATEVTAAYLDRIEAHADTLAAILSVNDEAMTRARELDAQFKSTGLTGPLHGIPLVLKDNHDTATMPTTAGSVAFAEFIPDSDAFVVKRLREAGAIVLAKAALQELSFGVDTVSSLGGTTRNPYALSRRPAGSSGGTAAAVASNLATVGTGTDTCSSIRSPPAFTSLVGIRPTLGLVSRSGIVPLSSTQDTAGPIARTVGDAARVLDAMVGFDPADPLTARGVGKHPDGGYVSHLDAAGLEGARIGVCRDQFGVEDTACPGAATADAVTATVDDAIDEMAAAGATIVEDVSLVDEARLHAARVVTMEFKRDFNAYLAAHTDPPVESLEALVETGTIASPVERRIRDSGALAVDVDGLEDDPAYLGAVAERERLRTAAEATLVEADLDAVVYPPSAVLPVEIPAHQPFSAMRCELASHTGLPAFVVPAGFVDGVPVGIELLGRAFTEPRLFELAYAFEQATHHRRPPEAFS